MNHQTILNVLLSLAVLGLALNANTQKEHVTSLLLTASLNEQLTDKIRAYNKEVLDYNTTVKGTDLKVMQRY